MKNPEKYTSVGAEIPKGILLAGPPGTGKTLMARALAGEAGCKFYYKSGSEFDEIFVGVGSKRVRELFKKARKDSPSIIFIDEIDAMTASRNPMFSSVSRNTINQLLTEMDGFKPTDNVIVIGATNMANSIDKAVLRPGRFDKIINVSLPDIKGRKKIIEYYLKKIKHDEDVSQDTLAKATTGFSGAQIKNFVNIAILNAIKEGRKLANHNDFEFALDRVTMGIGRKSMHVSEEEKLMTAYHEGGHTLVNLLTPGTLPLHKVTILPRGPALGFTAMLPDKDYHSQTRREIISRIDVALGGRIAEELIYGNDRITTGCSSDMNQATDLAYAYVRTFGMNADVNLISANKKDFSDGFNYRIDQEVQRILELSLQRTRKLVLENKERLDKLATELVKKETMDAKEVKGLLDLI